MEGHVDLVPKIIQADILSHRNKTFHPCMDSEIPAALIDHILLPTI